MINPQITQKINIHSLIISNISQSQINHDKQILNNTLNFLKQNGFIEHINIVETKINENKQQLNLYNTSINRLINLKYDNQNIKNLNLIEHKNKIEYIEDKNEYLFINKQQTFKDISLLQILKILRETHKINNFDYKESIKRINNKQPLKNKVVCFINSYYSTIKTNTAKHTIKKLKQKENNKPFIYCERNNLKYKVFLKKNFRLTHTFKNNTLIYTEYNNQNIETEFNNKFNIDNTFKSNYTD